MTDFTIFNVRWLLDQQITTYDVAGHILPDDGSYQQEGAEKLYLFAEFLAANGMLAEGGSISRTPALELKASQLTEDGLAFARYALDRWLKSRKSPPRPADLATHLRKLRDRERSHVAPTPDPPTNSELTL